MTRAGGALPAVGTLALLSLLGIHMYLKIRDSKPHTQGVRAFRVRPCNRGAAGTISWVDATPRRSPGALPRGLRSCSAAWRPSEDGAASGWLPLQRAGNSPSRGTAHGSEVEVPPAKGRKEEGGVVPWLVQPVLELLKRQQAVTADICNAEALHRGH